MNDRTPSEGTAARATFRPHERMKDPTAFKRAFDRKKPASDESLVVHGVENGLDHARIGISVGKKKVRRAHARNRIKRIVREVFRLTKSNWPIGIDYVIVPRTATIDFDKARESLPALAVAAARRLGNRNRPGAER